MLTLGFSSMPCACAANGSIAASVTPAAPASLRNRFMGSSNGPTDDSGGLGYRHSRESGNPVSFVRTTLGPRFRGDDDSITGTTPVLLAGFGPLLYRSSLHRGAGGDHHLGPLLRFGRDAFAEILRCSGYGLAA